MAPKKPGKEVIRKTSLAIRKALTSREQERLSRKILKKLLKLSAFKKAERVGTYLSFGSEVSTSEIPGVCWKSGKVAAVPVTARGIRKTFFSEIRPKDPFTFSELGTSEPPRSVWRVIPTQSLDVIIVPGIAFDHAGYRVGYGGGVFDRLLESTPRTTRVGLAFECQLASRLPRNSKDQQLDFLITERRILRWRRKR
jgi:5-formyltetrahydrofolate cyclo-ligase